MALLVTVDNRPIFLDSKVANLLWLVKTGECKGTPKTIAKVKMIAKWYLNKDTAPVSYLMQNPKVTERRIPGSNNTISQARLPYVDK